MCKYVIEFCNEKKTTQSLFTCIDPAIYATDTKVLSFCHDWSKLCWSSKNTYFTI